MPRLFVAVWRPDEVPELPAVLPSPEADGLRWTERDQWLITLRFPGAVEDRAPVVEVVGRFGGRCCKCQWRVG